MIQSPRIERLRPGMQSLPFGWPKLLTKRANEFSCDLPGHFRGPLEAELLEETETRLKELDGRSWLELGRSSSQFLDALKTGTLMDETSLLQQISSSENLQIMLRLCSD